MWGSPVSLKKSALRQRALFFEPKGVRLERTYAEYISLRRIARDMGLSSQWYREGER